MGGPKERQAWWPRRDGGPSRASLCSPFPARPSGLSCATSEEMYGKRARVGRPTGSDTHRSLWAALLNLARFLHAMRTKVKASESESEPPGSGAEPGRCDWGTLALLALVGVVRGMIGFLKGFPFSFSNIFHFLLCLLYNRIPPTACAVGCPCINCTQQVANSCICYFSPVSAPGLSGVPMFVSDVMLPSCGHFYFFSV